MDPLQAYSAFIRTFEAGSFSAVAREMGTTQSAVSKQIAALEKSLAVQLFSRTTRRLQPTAEALRLYEHVRQLLDAVESLRTTTGRDTRVRGTLRVALPNAYGRHRICPLVPAFLAAHPELRLELALTDHDVDLVSEGFELGIRIGDLPPSTLTARQIDIVDQALVASPAYLSRRGSPESPVELTDHECLVPGDGARPSRWEFESEHGRQVVDVSGRLQVNDADAVLSLTRAGQGIALLPSWLVEDDCRSATLQRLLPEFYPPTQRVSVVYPKTRFLTLRARAFIDYLLNTRGTARKP